MRLSFLSLPLSVLFFAFSCTMQEQPPDDYPNPHLLLEAAELNELVQNGEVFVIDVRPDPGDSFIPGAAHFPAVQQLADPDHPVNNFLIGPETFSEKMQELGLNNTGRVVIYDNGNALAAARLFYALEVYGFSNAAILNGGFEGWLAEELPVAAAPAAHERGTFTANIQQARSCDFDYVMEAVHSPDKIIFDVRTADEYSGVDQRAERSGHIPGAIHLEWSNVLEPEGIPYFLSAAEIQAKYDVLGITRDKEVIPHCQSNVRGAHAYFTLRLMGYDSVRPYEGSWAEYGNRDDAVIE